MFSEIICIVHCSSQTIGFEIKRLIQFSARRCTKHMIISLGITDQAKCFIRVFSISVISSYELIRIIQNVFYMFIFFDKNSFTSCFFHFLQTIFFLESNPRKSFLAKKIKNIKNSALAFIPCLRQKCNELRILCHVIDRNCHMIASTAIKL